MNIARTMLLAPLLLALPNAALGKVTVPENRPYVKADVVGYYSRCIPKEKQGDKGFTQILKVRPGGDELIDKYSWYNQEGVVLEWSKHVQKLAVLRVRQDRWVRKRVAERVELGFYLGGKFLRSYTTEDLLTLGAKKRKVHVDENEFHFEEVADFQLVDRHRIDRTGDHVFTIKVADDTFLQFDIHTGKLLKASRKVASFAILSADGSPLIATDDIVAYAWEKHTLTLKRGVRQRLRKRLMNKLVSGYQFQVVANSQQYYRGMLTSSESSKSFSTPIINLTPLDKTLTENQIRIDLGYPSPKFFKGDDPRNANAIRRSLEKAKLLEGSEKKRRPIREVQETYGGDIMKLKGVVGHGIGRKENEDALMIFVKDARAKDYLDNLLSNNIEGYPVVFKVTGPVKAKPNEIEAR